MGTRVSDSAPSLLRTALAVVLLPPGILVYSAAAWVKALLGASPRRVHSSYLGFARYSLWIAGVRLEVHGAEHLDPEQAYVVVSNHESNGDPPVVIAGLPDTVLRFVVKQQIMKIPVFGHALRTTGNVTVVRQRDPGDVKRIQDTMDDRQSEVSMLFFAEGTRARDGSFREFKTGAFATALRSSLPILPVAIAGTYHALGPESVWIRPGTAILEVGPPIPIDGLDHDDRSALRDQTHEAVGKLRARARERLRALGQEPGGVD